MLKFQKNAKVSLVVFVAVVMSLSACQPGQNASYNGSGTIVTESTCLADLNVDVTAVPHAKLVKIFQNSSDQADKTGLVETVYIDSVRTGIQVFDSTRTDTLTMASWDIKSDILEGFYHYEWFFLLGQNDEIPLANSKNVVEIDSHTYKANLAQKLKSFKGMKYSVTNCLITDLEYLQDGQEMHVEFDYSLDDEAVNLLDLAWAQIDSGSDSGTDGEIPSESYAVDYSESVPDFPSSIDGYELSYQSDVIEWRVFEDDVWWVPIEEYANGARMSCSDEFWVVRWSSANPDVEMDAAVGLNDVGEFSFDGDFVSGGRGYMADAGCVAPAIRFGRETSGRGANLADVYAEYQLWTFVPSI